MIDSYKDLDSQHFGDVRAEDDTIDTDAKPGGVLEHRKEPVHVWQLPGRAKMIACGGAHNVAVLEDENNSEETTLVTWGMGHGGQLARSRDVPTGKRDDGLPELGHPFYRGIDAKTGQKYYKQDLVMEHFLKPKPVIWAAGLGRKIVTHVGCGDTHTLVAARSPGEPSSRLYAAGMNAYGKLGMGDEIERHEMTLVSAIRRSSIICGQAPVF